MTPKFKFPRRVRIHGGECGAVARALHHEAQKDALMSYEQSLVKTEKAVLRQADSGKALGSTFNERKQMSTKTTLKRIALVAVSALGFGLLSAAPSKAATVYDATYTAPTAYDTQITSVGAGATSAYVGAIQIDLSSKDSALSTSVDSATVTISANDAAVAKDVTFLGALSLSLTVQGTTTASTALTAATGYNTLNNGSVTLGSSATTRFAYVLPTAAAGTASGRAWLNLNRSALASTDSGAKVKYVLTVDNAGVVRTFTTFLTLTIGAKAGTDVITPSTGLANINAGASGTATVVASYTNTPASTALTARGFTLGGTATAAEKATFSVAATATGGAVSCVRSSSNQNLINCTPTKDALAGTFTITYTITVNALASATAGQTITVDAFTFTVAPYTPVYNSSTVNFSSGANGYRQSAAAGGDGFVWAKASNIAGVVATVAIQQVDQNGANISLATYTKAVNATITGKGSLTAITGADVVTKSQTYSAANGLVTGTDTFTLYSDGTSGEGTLTITVDGTTVATYKLRFYGDAATIEAKLLRPIGNTTAGTLGAEGATAAVTNNLDAGAATKTVGADTVTQIAVTVKDANGWAIPTTAPTVTSSNRAVVSTASRLFIDSGVSVPASLKYSAGTFVQHFSFTTLTSTSGSTSDLTFSFVNGAGTALSATPVKVTVGGAIATGKLVFDKAIYDPGAVATLTATATDAAGNKPYDGQDLMNNGCETTLGFTCPTNFKLVDGVKSREVYAPIASGAWTLTIYDVADKKTTASATVRSPGDDAKKAADAATAAAEASGDAAAEATDAANAANDAATLAAEAADAATVAAEEAREAADAATAAVEELATQVATLMAALKAQITTLANTVAKIAKKVKA